MTNDRRNRAPGATYAFVVNLRDRRSNLLVTQIDHLRAAVQSVRATHPFGIDAWIVLPDHMHCLWTLPPGDMACPLRLKLIKGRFSQTQLVARLTCSPYRTLAVRGLASNGDSPRRRNAPPQDPPIHSPPPTIPTSRASGSSSPSSGRLVIG